MKVEGTLSDTSKKQPKIDECLSGNNSPLKRISLTAIIATFRRLLHIARPEWINLCVAFGALTINSATNMCFPWIMGQAVDRASNKDDLSQFYIFLAGAGGLFSLGSIASWIRVYLLGFSNSSICVRLKKQLFARYMSEDISFYDSCSLGEIISLLENDVERASESITEKLASGLRSLNSAINGSIFLFMTSPKLSALTLSMVPMVGIGAMALAKQSKHLMNKMRLLHQDIMSHSIERMEAISTVKLNYRQRYEIEVYTDKCCDYLQLGSKAYYYQGAMMAFVNIASNLSLIGTLLLGGRLIARREMTPGDLTRFAMQSAFVGLGFSGLVSFHSDMMRGLEAAERLVLRCGL